MGKLFRVVGEGTYPAYKLYEGLISDHLRLLQQHCEREKKGLSTGSPPALKEAKTVAGQEQEQRRVDVEKPKPFE